MKTTAFWDVVIAQMVEAVRTSETSVYLNENARRYIPESCHLHFVDGLVI
jgi:hypothetical protein